MDDIAKAETMAANKVNILWNSYKKQYEEDVSNDLDLCFPSKKFQFLFKIKFCKSPGSSAAGFHEKVQKYGENMKIIRGISV